MTQDIRRSYLLPTTLLELEYDPPLDSCSDKAQRLHVELHSTSLLQVQPLRAGSLPGLGPGVQGFRLSEGLLGFRDFGKGVYGVNL